MAGYVGAAMNLAFSIPDYIDERKKGHGVGYSVGKAALNFAFWEMMGPAALPVGLAAGAYQGIKQGVSAAHNYGYTNAKLSSQAYRPNFGGPSRFSDDQVASTMRQRGIQAMQQSQLQGYSNLGNEARSYFR